MFVASDRLWRLRREVGDVIERRGFADSVQQVVLVSDPATPGVYFGTLPAGQDGQYVLRAQDHEVELWDTPLLYLLLILLVGVEWSLRRRDCSCCWG